MRRIAPPPPEPMAPVAGVDRRALTLPLVIPAAALLLPLLLVSIAGRSAFTRR
jgi:hypothetical protein